MSDGDGTNLVRSELLCYLARFYNTSPVESLKQAVKSAYTEDDIVNAADLLWQSYNGCEGLPEKPRNYRKNTGDKYLSEMINALK